MLSSEFWLRKTATAGKHKSQHKRRENHPLFVRHRISLPFAGGRVQRLGKQAEPTHRPTDSIGPNRMVRPTKWRIDQPVYSAWRHPGPKNALLCVNCATIGDKTAAKPLKSLDFFYPFFVTDLLYPQVIRKLIFSLFCQLQRKIHQLKESLSLYHFSQQLITVEMFDR